MTENRGTLPKALWPGVKTWWGDYNKHPEEHKSVFDVRKSNMAFEEDVELIGMGLAKVKDEGDGSSYDNLTQGPISRYQHVTYSLGYRVTEEEFDDNQYKKVAKRRTQALAFSHRTTKEIIGADILNRSVTAGYTGGDGVTLLSTSHPVQGGTQSNTLAVAADLSESSVEDLLIQIMNAEDNRGLPIAIKPKRLIIPPALAFEAERIVKSTLRSGTDHNDTNAMRSLGVFQQDPMVYHYLTDTDAWYISTDVSDGLICYNRKAREIRRDGDFDTGNLKVKGIERYSFGWTDWRGLFGTEGAA